MPRTSQPPARRPDLWAIRLLVLDVDGVMTDGGILLDDRGRELKRFDCLDGSAIKYWQRAGKQAVILSGRGSPAVVHRAAELGVAVVRQNAKNKLPAYLEILTELGLTPRQAAVMGDDLPDLPLLRRCGLAIAPANAAEEVKAEADLVTERRGGHGAVREVVEYVLRQTGLWEGILSRYNQPQGGRGMTRTGAGGSARSGRKRPSATRGRSARAKDCREGS